MVKILIMDDEPSLRNIVYNIVKPLGHPIFTSEDGHQAIEVAKRENPDIALLDMRVPDMDGLEVLVEPGDREVRALAVIVFIGNVHGIRDPGLQLGIAGRAAPRRVVKVGVVRFGRIVAIGIDIDHLVHARPHQFARCAEADLALVVDF